MAGAGTNPNEAIADFIRRRERLPIAQIERAGVAAGRPLELKTLTHDESTLAIGELLLRMGDRHEKALDLFEQVSAQSPDDLRARVDVDTASAHLQARDWQRAAVVSARRCRSSSGPRSSCRSRSCRIVSAIWSQSFEDDRNARITSNPACSSAEKYASSLISESPKTYRIRSDVGPGETRSPRISRPSPASHSEAASRPPPRPPGSVSRC